MPLLTTTTLADRLGGWPEAALCWVTVALMIWLAAGALRRRGRPDGGPSGPAPQ